MAEPLAALSSQGLSRAHHVASNGRCGLPLPVKPREIYGRQGWRPRRRSSFVLGHPMPASSLFRASFSKRRHASSLNRDNVFDTISLTARGAGSEDVHASILLGAASTAAFSAAVFYTATVSRPTALVGPSPLPFASISVQQRHQPLQSQRLDFGEVLAFVQYKVLQALLLPTLGRLLLVALVALPLLAAATALLVAASGEQFGEALRRCYQVLNNVPGTDLTCETDPRVAVLLNGLYVAGLLSFAVLVGMVADDVKGAVEAAKFGNSRVPERNHALVVGHNRQLPEVLRQMAHIRADRGPLTRQGPLVVLSPLAREELGALLEEELGPAGAARVVTRQGSGLKVADLQRVSAGHASTVILLAPDEEAAEGGEQEEEAGSRGLTLEAQQAVTLASLQHLRGTALRSAGGGVLQRKPQTVVVASGAHQEHREQQELQEWEQADGEVEVAHVSPLRNLARIRAQCAAQPGLGAVLSSLLRRQPGAPTFHVQEVSKSSHLVGLTYGEARRHFPSAVLCGYYSAPSSSAASPSSLASTIPTTPAPATTTSASGDAAAVLLNPDGSTLVQEDHAFIFLAHQEADLRPSALPHPPTAPPAAATTAAAAAATATEAKHEQEVLDGAEAAANRRVVVLAFDGRWPGDLIKALGEFCPEGSEAVLVAKEDMAAFAGSRTRKKQAQLKVSTVVGDPRTRGSLSEAEVQEADAVILTGLDDVRPDLADAQALSTLLQLQALLQTQPAQQSQRPLNLVCGVTDPRVRDIMECIIAVNSYGGGSSSSDGSGAVAPRRGLILDNITPHEVMAGALAQVASEPRLSGVFQDLYSPEGVEVYMRSPAVLGLPYNQPLSWQEVQDKGRMGSVTVIGVVRGSTPIPAPVTFTSTVAASRNSSSGGSWGGGSARSKDGGSAPADPRVLLGVQQSLELRPGDQLVVLAEEPEGCTKKD
ncbi:hypothetical protein Agub_g3361 [Astrephomene gubernaculifera]|uniref:Ion channel POLLUX n=1 Tax=Astrephomene gubernaculifera TaxID=47775 RepID=A0AAD3HIE1_9CHLO|nr:hypothetical protein Agub_g3361 [Astrephomene gubernaculifera]